MMFDGCCFFLNTRLKLGVLSDGAEFPADRRDVLPEQACYFTILIL